MRATEELAKRQREYPLGPEGDRVLELFRSLPQLPDANFEAVRTSTHLVVGEMNLRQPNAKTFHLPDGSHLITIFTGLIDFYTTACNLIMQSGTFHTDKGQSEGLTLEDVKEDLQQLFLRWTPQGIREGGPEELRLSPADPLRQKDASTLLEGALRFVLCHELGHVAFYKPSHSAKKPAGLTREQETQSDVAGVQASTACTPGLGAMRMNLAGCVVSLRILATFGMTGHVFTGDHPDPLSRLDTVFSSLRKLCVLPGRYWWVTPIAYTFDELLETVGQRLVGGSDVLSIRPDRTFSRLCAVLENAMVRPESTSVVVPLLAGEFEEATEAQMRVIARFAAELFSPGAYARYEAAENWGAKGRIFRSLYDQWPTRAIAAFNEAFKAYTWPGTRIDGDNWMSE